MTPLRPPEAREGPQHLCSLVAAPGLHHARRAAGADEVKQEQPARVPARGGGGRALSGGVGRHGSQHRGQLRGLEGVQLPARLHADSRHGQQQK
jgi:hypothetical protein